MANLTPIVEPVVNSTGNPITTFPKVMFEKAIDVGSVNESNFFIVSLRKEGEQDQNELLQVSNAISDIVPADLEYRKVNLADTDTFTGKDYGTTLSAGSLYRSEVTLKPKQPLRPNTNYAVIVSKNTSLITVFDASLVSGSLDTLKVAGVYTGLTADTYEVLVTIAGTKNEAYYTWKRLSDNHVSAPLQARGRFIEIDRGLKIKFDTADYTVGTKYSIKVKPADKLVDIFSWNFSTGLGSYKVPDDEKSGDVINLPVVNPNVPPVAPAATFKVVSIEPTLGASLVKIANKAIATLYGVIIQAKVETSAYNGWKFEFVGGGTAGSEVVTQPTADKILVEVAENLSSVQQVVDALNAHVGVSADFEAVTVTPTLTVKAGKTRITKGVSPNQVIITFNKNVDASTLEDNIRLMHSEVYPGGPEEELYFTTTVNNNIVTLTIED